MCRRANGPGKSTAHTAAFNEMSSALQADNALAVVAAALFNPFQAAVGIRSLVRLVYIELIRAGKRHRLVRLFACVFRRNRRRKHRRRLACSALLLAKLFPLAAL